MIEKLFWKAIQPFLFNKIVSKEKLTLIETDGIVESDNDNVVKILNTHFSNIIYYIVYFFIILYHILSNLEIVEYGNSDPISDNINNPVIKSIVKYRNHPSILKVGEVCNKQQESHFSFTHVDKGQTLK